MATRAERALNALSDAVADRDTAEARLDRAHARVGRLSLRAHKAGLTYKEIAELIGRSEIRVAQILRAEREAS